MTTGARSRNQELDPINLTPLLDCILNLIFFFLLATTIKENTRVMDVQLPQAGVSTQAPQVPKEMVVTIGFEGNIFLNEDAVTSAQLKTRLADVSTSLPIRIRTDKSARVQPFFDVMSICRETGHSALSCDVKPEGAAR